MSAFTTQCFSSQCGSCAHCCSFKAVPDKKPEGLSRADDLIKIMGAENVSKEFKDYSNKMAKIEKKYHYDDPWMDDKLNPIPMPKTKFKGSGEGLTQFDLLDTPHGAICDDPLCKAFFNISDDGVHALYHTRLPVYTRTSIGDDIQLCAVCIGM